MTEKDDKQNERHKAEEELRLLYQVSTQDLDFFKQQQWSVTNYVLLLYGTFFGISQIDNLKVSSCERFVFCLVATALGIVGIYLVIKLEKSIKARRNRLDKVRRLFTKTFCLAWRSKHKDPDSSAIAYLLCVVMGFGAVFLWWLVFVKSVITTQLCI
jgi:hypothetical protein